MAKGQLKPLSPITEFDAHDVKHAFRYLQDGDHLGKITLKMPEDYVPLATAVEGEPVTVRGDVAYFLAGGIGGLGRSLALWLIERGARHLVFLSRSAGTSESSHRLSVELESMGCSVTIVGGSVNDISDIQKAIAASPVPIRGVFQLAMVQRVRISSAVRTTIRFANSV